MALTGSTKRSEWERRWDRSLPYDWKDSTRIQVDGDGSFKTISLRFLGACMVSAFLWVIFVWAVYGWITP